MKLKINHLYSYYFNDLALFYVCKYRLIKFFYKDTVYTCVISRHIAKAKRVLLREAIKFPSLQLWAKSYNQILKYDWLKEIHTMFLLLKNIYKKLGVSEKKIST